jgi:hypothetical protein
MFFPLDFSSLLPAFPLARKLLRSRGVPPQSAKEE